jgi:uncharacterized membrane protein YdbT with pleckstrin-like domain
VGYLEKNMLPGETVAYRAHLHPIIFLQSALFGLIGLALVIFGLVNPGMTVVWVLGAVLLIYAAAFGIGRAIHYLSSEFAITNKRLVIKVGLIQRETLEMVLSKVETIRVDQTIIGRLLNYGTIVVTGTGGTNEPFKSIANPLEFRRQVQTRTSS